MAELRVIARRGFSAFARMGLGYAKAGIAH
jgi:hypothetical protein